MDPQAFDEIAETLKSEGSSAAFDHLVEVLKKSSQHHRVFDALTLKARHELGIPLYHSGDALPLASDLKAKYEERLLDACRQVGRLFLDTGDIGTAFQYFNMIGETELLREAIERFEPTPDDDRIEAVIEVAVTHGVHPAKGLEWIVQRYGCCQAITACEGILSQESRQAVREACVGILVGTLERDLVERVTYDRTEREGKAPESRLLSELVAGHPELFEDHNYHIDTSHLNAVVRMARILTGGPAVRQAVELCCYGRMLSERFRYPEAPPFEDVYEDSYHYLRALLGEETDLALERFRAKADATVIEEQGTYPVEVYVNLLVRMGRWREAAEYASKRINLPTGGVGLSCPSINELWHRAGDPETLRKQARVRGDLVSYFASLLAP